METQMEIFAIDDKFSIHFLYVPDGYEVKKLEITEHETRVLGRLKNFNRIKLFSSWKKQHGDLVVLFTDALNNRG